MMNTSNHGTREVASGRADGLRWLGLALVLAPLLVRATSQTSSLPEWDLDPAIFSLSSPAIGPAGSMFVDVLVLLGAAVIFLGEVIARRGFAVLPLGLGVVGSLMCLAHGWLLPSPDSAAITGSLGNQRIGMAWMGAMWGAIAIGHAARDERFRRTVLGVLLGFLGLLALRGVMEVYAEHAETMRMYNADPKRFIESRGWTMESTMARQFIRRISQPEASGWFGLSNVYASFAAFGVVASAGWLIGVLKARRGMELAAAAVSLVVCATALFVSQSKGGVAFAAFGLVLLVGARPLRVVCAKFTRFSSLVGPACIAGVLSAIAVRGVIGERIGELSILFRAFYIEAAVRMFGGKPGTGVGPDGFQQAYLLAKNPLSPEEVSSPHSILFDWIATLGVAGVAWGAVLALGAVWAGRELVASEDTTHEVAPPTSPVMAMPRKEIPVEAKVAMLILAVATIGASWLQSPLIPLDMALVRVLGLLLGCFVAYWAAAGSDSVWVRRGLAAGALTVMAHAQIEVTLSLATSAGLAMVACAIGTAPRIDGVCVCPRNRAGRMAISFTIAAAGFIAWFGCLPALNWQVRLEEAAAEARVVASFEERYAALSQKKPSPLYPRDDGAKFFGDLGKEIGRAVPQNQEGLDAARIEMARRRLGSAAEKLKQAIELKPGEWRVAREASRLHLQIASGYLHGGDLVKADAAAATAEKIMTPPTARDAAVGSAAWWRALAVVEESYAKERDSKEWMQRAYERLEQAGRLDPYNLDIVMRLMRIAKSLGNEKTAKKWAMRARELDEQARLDKEARGLSKSDRAEVADVIEGP